MSTIRRSYDRESSAQRGWLSSFLGDAIAGSVQADRRRLLLAFAISIAVIEVVAGIFPWHRATVPQQKEETITIARITHIMHRATPTPKPQPTPKPTPKPIVHAKIVAPVQQKPHVVNPGKPAEHQHIRRVASARPLVRTVHHLKPADIHVRMGGHGVGTSTTAKANTGGVGPGGTGTGESGTGNGTGGAPAAHEPCGAVYFEPNTDSQYDSSTGRVWEHITMSVHFPDGSTQDVDLDYPFYYPSKSVDPFQPQNATVDATFQFPPADKRASEPPLVQYVIAHTTSDGYTLLRECPK